MEPKVTVGVWLTGVHPEAAGGGAEAPGDPAAAAAARTGHAAGEDTHTNTHTLQASPLHLVPPYL